MDPRVLEAQEWVNATYSGVAGYERCTEDGLTGWSAMLSLVMGLQHKLGISPVVAAFGPATQRKLRELGEIGIGWSHNANLVRIIQHALFCKGYQGKMPNGDYGQFDELTASATRKIRIHMGVPTSEKDDKLCSYIFPCHLNMDAYLLLTGVTEKVRHIQQWLNSRYWQKSGFTIGPTDGHYSPGVQKSLLFGIQSELGIANPNGNSDPQTQAGLKKKTLKQGDTGVFVELFSAACVFNEPVPSDSEGVRSSKRSTFDSKLSEFVGIFQLFSELPKTKKVGAFV